MLVGGHYPDPLSSLSSQLVKKCHQHDSFSKGLCCKIPHCDEKRWNHQYLCRYSYFSSTFSNLPLRILSVSSLVHLRCYPFWPLPHTVRWRYNVGNFLKNIHKRHLIIRPLGRGMGYIFVDTVSDWYYAWVLAIIYVITYYTGPRYNDTRLYNVMMVVSAAAPLTSCHS